MGVEEAVTGMSRPAVASVVTADAAAVVNVIQVVVRAFEGVVVVVEGHRVVEGAWVRLVLARASVVVKLELAAYLQDL